MGQPCSHRTHLLAGKYVELVQGYTEKEIDTLLIFMSQAGGRYTKIKLKNNWKEDMIIFIRFRQKSQPTTVDCFRFRYGGECGSAISFFRVPLISVGFSLQFYGGP